VHQASKCFHAIYDELNVSLPKVQEARNNHDDESVKRSINEYEDALARYIPVLMAQAKIYWDLELFQQVSILITW